MINKDATDLANKLDAEATAIRAKLGQAHSVVTYNPLGQALGRILTMDAAKAVTLQQGLVAAIVELLIAAALVLPEVLRRDPPQRQAPRAEARQPRSSDDAPREIETPTMIEHEPRPPATRAIEQELQPATRAIAGVQLARPALPAADVDTVGRCMIACLKREEGAEMPASAVYLRYKRWCDEQSVAPLPMQAFAEQFAQRCRKAGIRTRRDENKVYCLNIGLSA